MSEKQRTIKKAVSISGVGLHTGQKVTLTFKPAPGNHGYKFQRIDLPNQPVIDADVDNVVDTARGTTLEQNGARVSTTEHVLAALLGLQIDNAIIELDGPEVPIMDGSSKPFIAVLNEAGAEEQNEERVYFELKSNLTYEDPIKKVEMLAVPQDEFRVTVMVDYNSPVLGTQHASMYNIREFQTEIGKCRTFVFLHELEALLQHNLIKGGDLDNAIVMVDKPISDESLAHLRKVFNKENVEVKGQGVLNNTELHFFNEPARHKLLDIVGDLALVGVPLKAHILAARPGHAGNIAFAKKIKELIKSERAAAKKAATPVFDLNKEPLFNINDIMKILPHRQPFLLIDKIMELTPERVVGVKNVTMNEDFFRGHFPDKPVMPGVLLVEAMAQTGGILVLKTVPDPENYLTYFMKIDGVKFKQMVGPGDTVIFDLKLLTPIRRGICHMKGTAYVNNKPVMEAEMMAQIVKVKNNEPSLSLHTS
jgi:UDP-3-O-[3-hydroxymyristoyl] N-acetylglucosamine deacetylase/3-hydroxyacyl-[acyl-carrier-protein] dehydratase